MKRSARTQLLEELRREQEEAVLRRRQFEGQRVQGLQGEAAQETAERERAAQSRGAES